MNASLDPDLLRTFVAFSDTGSFTRAARLVNRTQSAVSMQMRRLEDLIGRPLFQKDGRHVVLTDDGKALVNYGRRILRLHDEALARFSGPALTGSIRLGTPDDYATELLPLVLSRFAETYPDVHLEVRCDRTVVLRDLLDRGEIDLAILSQTDEAIGHDGIPMWREPAVWVTSDRHLAHERDPLPLALFLPPCAFRRSAIAALDSVGRAYRLAYSSHSAMGVLAAVRSGLAVSVIARGTLWPGMRELTPAEGFPPLPSVNVMLCRSNRAGNEAVSRLTDHIRQGMQDQLAA